MAILCHTMRYMDKKTKPVSIRMPVELHEFFSAAARKNERSFAQEVAYRLRQAKDAIEPAGQFDHAAFAKMKKAAR
jgi:hypothetical protein